MNKFTSHLRALKAVYLVACLTLGLTTSVSAQIGQVPLLTRSASADPNITIMMDDSGSMAADYIFQKGGSPGGYGMSGYGGIYDDESPDFNKIYYDPRITYQPRLDRTYTSLPKASTSSLSSFNVYFHKKAGTDVSGIYDPTLATAFYTPSYTPASATVAYPNTVNNSVISVHKFPKRTDCAGATSCTYAEELQNYANWEKWHSTRLNAAMTGVVKAFSLQEGTFRLGWGRINAPDSGSMSETITTSGVTTVYGTSTTGGYETFGFANSKTIKKGNDGSYKDKISKNYSATAGFTSGTVTFRLLEDNTDIEDNKTIESKNWEVDITINGTKTSYTKSGPLTVFTQAVTYPIGNSTIKVDVQKVRNNSSSKKAFIYVTITLPVTTIVTVPIGTTTAAIGTSTVVYTGTQYRLDSGVNAFTGAHRSRLVDWITGPSFNKLGSTPLVQALNAVGKYYMRKDDFGPWGNNPSTIVTKVAPTIDPNQLSCRRSYTIMLTDGYWNGTSAVQTTVPTANTSTGSTISIGDIDSVNGAQLTGINGATYKYTAAAPYKGPNGSDPVFTLADVAMYYWGTDLRPDLGNAVPTIAGLNESFWQNMSLYTIAFGVYGTLPQTTTTFNNLTTGAQTWPTIKTNDNTGVDDLWHSAINGRGQMLSATNADELSEAISGMMNQINKATASQSGIAASTLSLISGTKKFSPQYTTGVWTGNIIASELEPTTGNFKQLLWSVENINVDTGSVASTIPAPASRNIVVWKDSVSKAVSFTWANISGTPALNTAFTNGSSDLLNYLRGDKTKEGAGNPYRTRQAILGDIVNSTPAFVKDTLDLNYDKLPSNINGVTTGQSSYKTFLTSKQSRSDGVLFVGANDGMLHGFKESNGAEVFAYIPKAVLPNLSLLAEKSYAHRYYVDGPIVETDAYSTADNAWKNIITGSTGAGAKAVFALDVTSLTNNNVLWEVDSSTTGFTDLGHVLTDVVAGPMATGEWAAVFGNGPYSGTGKAVLYVVNLHTGALIRAIDTGVAGANGLGGVRLVRNAEQQIIGVYAGDLKGNVWKFDLSSSNASNWSLQFPTAAGYPNGLPLFTAKDGSGTAKPITASVGIVGHPKGGNMVVVGTGKFYEEADMSTSQQQSMYGLWDQIPFGTITASVSNAISGTSSLVLQTVSTVQITGTTSVVITGTDSQTVGTQSVSYFTVSGNPIDYDTQRGWYINMPNSGQRLVYPVDVLRNYLLRLDTIVPGSISNGCSTTGAGAAYNYVLDAVTGSCNSLQVLDANGDGLFNAADLNVCGYTTSPDGRDIALEFTTRPPVTNPDGCELLGTCESGSPKGLYSLQSWQGNRILNAQTLCERTPSAPGCNPSTSGILSRDWRQLFMR